MNKINIIKLKDKRNKIAIAYSTKDRTDLTSITVPRILTNENVDIYWFDGSLTEDGKMMPLNLIDNNNSLCELHQYVDGGPDRAIIYALDYLKSFEYELTILIENDIFLEDGWLDEMLSSIHNAELDGFKVGATSSRVFAKRVMSQNDKYCLLFNSGAACIGLTQLGLSIILNNYRTTTAEELRAHLIYLTSVDFSNTWELTTNSTSTQFLSADWFFDIILYLHGLVVTSPTISFARNIDLGHENAVSTKLIHAVSDHINSLHSLIPTPNFLQFPKVFEFKLQDSPVSGMPLIPCHCLDLSFNDSSSNDPISFYGTWSRRWLQILGPFEIFGSGKIVTKVFSTECNLLLHTREDDAEIAIFNQKINSYEVIKLTSNTFAEINISRYAELGASVEISVTTGSIGFIGLDLPHACISYYLSNSLNKKLIFDNF